MLNWCLQYLCIVFEIPLTTRNSNLNRIFTFIYLIRPKYTTLYFSILIRIWNPKNKQKFKLFLYQQLFQSTIRLLKLKITSIKKLCIHICWIALVSRILQYNNRDVPFEKEDIVFDRIALVESIRHTRLYKNNFSK